MRVTRRLVISVAFSVAALAATATPALASTSSNQAAMATSTPRTADTSGFLALICREPGNSACVDLKNGTVKTGQPLILYNISAGTNMTWNFVFKGDVSSSGSTFTVGSGLNGQFNDAPIYQIQYANNENYCMGVPSDGSGTVNLEPCSSGNYWVLPEGTEGPQSTVVNVYQSNLIYGQSHDLNNPQYLNNTTTTNGSTLFTGADVEYWSGFGSD